MDLMVATVAGKRKEQLKEVKESSWRQLWSTGGSLYGWALDLRACPPRDLVVRHCVL